MEHLKHIGLAIASMILPAALIGADDFGSPDIEIPAITSPWNWFSRASSTPSAPEPASAIASAATSAPVATPPTLQAPATPPVKSDLDDLLANIQEFELPSLGKGITDLTKLSTYTNSLPEVYTNAMNAGEYNTPETTWSILQAGFNPIAKKLTDASEALDKTVAQQFGRPLENMPVTATHALLGTAAAATAYMGYRWVKNQQYTAPSSSEYQYFTLTDEQALNLLSKNPNILDSRLQMLLAGAPAGRYKSDTYFQASTKINAIDRWHSNLNKRLSRGDIKPEFGKNIPAIEQWSPVYGLSLTNDEYKTQKEAKNKSRTKSSSSWYSNLSSAAYTTALWAISNRATVGIRPEELSSRVDMQQVNDQTVIDWLKPEYLDLFYKQVVMRLFKTALDIDSKFKPLSTDTPAKSYESIKNYNVTQWGQGQALGIIKTPAALLLFSKYAAYQLAGEIRQLIDHAIASPAERTYIYQETNQLATAYTRWIDLAVVYIQNNNTNPYEIPSAETALYQATKKLQEHFAHITYKVLDIMDAQDDRAKSFTAPESAQPAPSTKKPAPEQIPQEKSLEKLQTQSQNPPSPQPGKAEQTPSSSPKPGSPTPVPSNPSSAPASQSQAPQIPWNLLLEHNPWQTGEKPSNISNQPAAPSSPPTPQPQPLLPASTAKTKLQQLKEQLPEEKTYKKPASKQEQTDQAAAYNAIVAYEKALAEEKKNSETTSTPSTESRWQRFWGTQKTPEEQREVDLQGAIIERAQKLGVLPPRTS